LLTRVRNLAARSPFSHREKVPEGRMRALAPALLLQDQQNPVENINKRLEHVTVQDPVNLEAFAFKERSPLFVMKEFMVFAVRRAIQFDHQLAADADKVGYVRRNGNLSSEFVDSQAAVFEVAPKFFLRCCFRMAELAGSRQSPRRFVHCEFVGHIFTCFKALIRPFGAPSPSGGRVKLS
jgi:hypothetical protein